MSRTYRRHVGENRGFLCYPHKKGKPGDRHIQKGWGPSTRTVGDKVVVFDPEVPCHRYNKKLTSRQRRLADKKIIKDSLRDE